ncbi:hypothetical protein RCZ04_23010 [Capnocytophaga sp. HP1101]
MQAQTVENYLRQVSQQQHIDIQWQERKTSLATEGIRSFVGYHQSRWVATLSVSKQGVSGSFQRDGRSYDITAKKGRLVFQQAEKGECATHDEEHKHFLGATARPALLAAEEEEQPKIANTQVLRVYRLAVTIAYNVFQRKDIMGGKVENVKVWWADLENYLNEAYERDLGIHLEIINDERLICKTPEEERFDPTKKSGALRYENNLFLKEILGEKNFEVGICISYFDSPGIKGEAQTEGAYTEFKAEAVARPTKDVIAHEVGHLFGGKHTYSAPLTDGNKTEYGVGQSIMSMGTPRDFFSLSSVQRIRKLLTTTPYYKDRAHTQVVGNASFPNIPYGILLNTQPPMIEKAKIKAEYIIPEDTFFQFYIPATDADSEQLLYVANQHDERIGRDETSITQYLTYKATTANPVVFKKEYSERTGEMLANSWDDSARGGVRHQIGTFNFWLAVSDAEPQNHYGYITQYDLVATKVTIKKGTPFKITTTPKKKYKGGAQLTLTWGVDNSIFKDTKVRILLSDDLGKTFKHMVVAETDNNGSKEITLPNISTTQAVLKVEVIDGLAFDLTNYNPKNGGFTIEKNTALPEPLRWASLPNHFMLSCEQSIPALMLPTVTGGCSPTVSLQKEERIKGNCDYTYTLKRIFTATDTCNQMLTYTQTISVIDRTPPTFAGALPQNISIKEGETTPTQVTLTATDNRGTTTVTPSYKEIKDTKGKLTRLIYMWEAKDACGNTTTHQQTITFVPKSTPIPLTWATLPNDVTVDCAKSIPAVVTPTAQGGCGAVVITRIDKELNKRCPNNFTLERTFTATDGCTTLTHTQRITVADTTPPTFVGTLPQDLTIEEGMPIPLQKSISAEDSCAGTPTVTMPSKEEYLTNGKLSKVVYTWIARDVCGNERIHKQAITITPKVNKPGHIDTRPDEVEIYNAVSTENGSNNYFRIENADDYNPITLLIFDEMGLKVYESNNYQQNGEYFRGYPNAKGVVGNKRLAGTYFYVLTYYFKGEQRTKKGFLYVR